MKSYSITVYNSGAISITGLVARLALHAPLWQGVLKDTLVRDNEQYAAPLSPVTTVLLLYN